MPGGRWHWPMMYYVHRLQVAELEGLFGMLKADVEALFMQASWQ